MKTLIVIGSTGSVGESISRRLLKDGFRVIGVGRKLSHLKSLSDKYLHYKIDLEKVTQSEKEFGRLIKENPEVSGFVHCAGFGEFDNIENMSLPTIEKLININLLSAIVVTKLLVPKLKSKNEGSLVYIGSEAGLKGSKKGAVYSASKFALRGFAQSIRDETAKNNVSVTIVNPGMIRGRFFEDKNFRPGKDEDNAIKPSDLAKLVAFIVKDRKGMIIDEINLSQTKKVIEFL
ncbi:MAG: short-chain dehydrogenase [Rhodobacteraceae bacterium]|nr:MAG: short-chain dehydrogenase [Paracoccaceae bacterium]